MKVEECKTSFSYRNSSNRFIGLCDIEVLNDSDRQIVIVTEPADNPGMSICNAFEDLFVQVCKTFKLDCKKVVWVEYWPQKSLPTFLKDDEWSLVKFELTNGSRAENPEWQYLGKTKEEALSKLGIE